MPEVVMPCLSDSIEKGTIPHWLRADGSSRAGEIVGDRDRHDDDELRGATRWRSPHLAPDAMRRNLAGASYVMAAAYMMRLAGSLGREPAHDLVYAAVCEARETSEPFETVLQRNLGSANNGTINPIPTTTYLGVPDLVCDTALRAWSRADEAPVLSSVLQPLSEL
jgi:hypothetical protein